MFKSTVAAMHKLLDDSSKPDLEPEELEIIDIKDSNLFK